VPIPRHHGVTSVTDLAPGDQAWFHNQGIVHHVATVMAVFHNLDFDRALWGQSEFPGSGFVFTLTSPQPARIAKTEVNRLLGHKLGFTWQGNLLITEEDSRTLADATALVIAS
jgi:hypothetical protein